MKVTVRELMDLGLWIEVCDELGINEWAVNEGRMSSSEEVEMTLEQALAVGLVADAAGENT